MKCPRCEADNPPSTRFCGQCATPLAVLCPSCRSANAPHNKFCGQCAAPLASQAAPRFPGPEAYTPRHLADRILDSKFTLEGERKQVTVLFADLKGSMELLADRDPEEARTILDPVLEQMMDAVHRYEGTVNQVMGDGIMALFGAPLAHEDHAVRACYAAIRMQDTIKRYAEELLRRAGIPIQIRVGLNSGDVVVRAIGSDLRMDYSAVGQTTHLAARMEQMAMAGSIMMTGDTLKLAEGYVHVKPFGRVPVKGLAEPVAVYEVIGAGSIRTRLQASAARGLTRFVGRDAEVEQLRLALDAAGHGQGQLVAVVGDPGVGKSRLVYELTHSHRTNGWLVLGAVGVSYGKSTAYLPVVGLLKAYFRIQDRDDHREIRERVTGKLLALDRRLEPTLPAFLSLLDVPVNDAEWQAFEPSQRRQRTLDAVKQWLLRESEVQPILLVFEDLHWVDAETHVLLDSLIDRLPAARVLLLTNYRPEFRHRWGSKTYYRQLRIDPLPPTSAEELLRPLLGDDASLAPVTRHLIERAEGNPLFLEESVWSLVETGALAGDRGAYRLVRPVEAIQIPASVQAIVAARIDRLDAPMKALLQSAAVIGHDVPFGLLEAIAGLAEDDVRRGLGHLQATEFLYETRLFPELEYTFKHALTLDVAYQSLLRERRRALHERVLDALTRQWAGREIEKVDLFAHHALRAELWDRAARYLQQSGEKAFVQARYHTSAAAYQAAIDALDQLGDAGDLTLKLDACLELWSARTSVGDVDKLGELAGKAEALAHALDDGPRLARVRVRQAQRLYFDLTPAGTLQSAIDTARDAFERADARDLRTRSYAQYLVGCACRDLGRLDDAVDAFEAGLALLDPQGRYGDDTGLVVPIYVSLSAWRAEAHASRGDFARAFASARAALHVATDIQHPSSLAVANDYLGYVHLVRGEPAAALPFLERALAIATEHDLFQATVRTSSHLACALAMLGERERGLGCLSQALQRWTGTMSRHLPGGGRAAIASAYLAAGVPAEARTEIELGLAEAAERNARGVLPLLLRLEAETLASDTAGARERLARALALAGEMGLRPDIAHCHLGLGQLFRRIGQREDAHAHGNVAARMFREMEMTYWLGQAEPLLRS